MALLAGVAYDPAAAVTKATSAALAMTAFDTTNLRVTFTPRLTARSWSGYGRALQPPQT